jgi:hypothetical protein
VKRSDLSGFRLAYAAWLFGLFAFFLPTATWNPVSRFDLTRAIVEHGSIRIDPYAPSTGDRAFAGGHWYTDKPPIPSFVAVPVYALVSIAQRARGAPVAFEAYGTELHPAVRLEPNKAFRQALYACSLATSGVGGIAIGLLLFELLRRRTTSLVAFASATLVLLGTPLFPYSTSFYSHVPSAALLLAAIVVFDRRGLRPLDAMPTAAQIRLAGACLALAPGCEYLTAAPAALIGGWILLKAPAPKRLSVAANLTVGAALPVLVVASYHTAAFGVPWRTGYSFMTKPEFVAGHAAGLMGIRLPSVAGVWGLTVGLRRGLFYLSPVSVLGLIFGIAQVKRRRDWAFAAGLASLGVLFFLNAGYYMWWGGSAAGPRHLIPGLPFLAAGIMLGLRARQSWVRGMTLLAGLVSVVNFSVLTAVGIEAPERGDLLYRYAWPRLEAGRLATFQGGSNLGLKLGLNGTWSLLPLVVWGLGGAAYLVSQLVGTRRRFSIDVPSGTRPSPTPKTSTR